MSRFVTRIPVDVEAVLKLLPNGSYIEGTSWNGSELEVSWSHHHLESPFTFQIDFPMEQLKARHLPKLVKMREACRSETCDTAGLETCATPKGAPAVMTGDKAGVVGEGGKRGKGKRN